MELDTCLLLCGCIPNGNLHKRPVIAGQRTAVRVVVLDQLRDDAHLKCI